MSFVYGDIEKKWCQIWNDSQLYKVENDHTKEKLYILDMFPYPSGAGLHVGHPLGYIASDIYSRYKRLKGYNVLHPIGFDAFGLPAEQYAIQTGIHPSISNQKNIGEYRKQLKRIGLSYDWSREVQTTDPDYFKWTQWIFMQLFDSYFDLTTTSAKPINDLVAIFEKNGTTAINAAGTIEMNFSAEKWNEMGRLAQQEILMNYRLAYLKESMVNWCEELGTVLANDQVKNGLSERGGFPVVKKSMKQWHLRITAYAGRMLDGLDTLDWSDALKTQQRNWIGQSVGALLPFDIVGHDDKLDIFTTRIDTIFGATYMVIAPEHPLIDIIVTDDRQTAVADYIKYVHSKSEVDRQTNKEVTGEFTGAFCINPFTQKNIPIYIGEYVLIDYGTGAIMAVPSDDERDMRFAKKFGIEIIDVVDKSKYPDATLHDKLGVLINSDFLNGMEVADALDLMHDKIEKNGLGKKIIQYKLRDANFGRQRYWGEPFPLYYDEDNIPVLVSEDELPVMLPDVAEFRPTTDGKSPLGQAGEWVKYKDLGQRETDTMPAVAGSSWYWLRYMDPRNNNHFAGDDAINYWKNVDVYIGGAEHAVAHLMYARFWNMFLFDNGLVPHQEPFQKLINQGKIQGVIESLLMKKVDNQVIFFCSDQIPKSDHHQYSMIPVPIEFVADCGKTSSYLDAKGISEFIQWSPDYASALFNIEGKNYTLQQFKDTENLNIVTYSESGKMSKSKYNVINPDSIIDTYGADCFRMYEMFLGPLETDKPWDTHGIDGVSKFLRKYYHLYYDDHHHSIIDEKTPSEESLKILNRTLKKIEDDINHFSFNTCISAFMIAVNDLKKEKCHNRQALTKLNIAMAPFAPFMCEELHHVLGNSDSVHTRSYPEIEDKYLVDSTIQYPICINGKKKDLLSFDINTPSQVIENEILAHNQLSRWLDGKNIVKVVIVPKKMVNIVAK